VCTEDYCETGVGCKTENVPVDCDDGDPCTEGDFCVNGQCVGGANKCQCQKNADCAVYEDGNLCNGTFFCDKNDSPYTCKVDPGSVVQCNENLNTFCSVQQCLPANGICVAVDQNEGESCDDDDGCTLEDECESGSCVGIPCSQLGMSCDGGECVEHLCGDGHLDPGEDCDDGNKADGDGCSSECKLESMALVPAGYFWMGCNSDTDWECSGDEYPYHSVYVPEFSIDTYEVTVSDYKQCYNNGGCSTPSTGLADCVWNKGGKDDYPINCVSWDQAKAYCAWAGKRLCSESEWEKAARDGDGRKYPWGNAPASCTYGVMYSGSKGCGTGGPMAVGSKPAGMSPYGVHDMSGNVWEYVEDCYHETYGGAPGDGSAWEKPGCGNNHVVRGGSFWSTASSLRASKRLRGEPGNGGFDIHVVGFRCCQ